MWILGIEFLPNDVFHKLVFWDMRIKLNLKAFLLLWYWFFLLGLIALAFQRLGQCGHISSTFGKYFEAKVVEKTRKILPTHTTHTGTLFAYLLLLSWPAYFRHNKHIRSENTLLGWTMDRLDSWVLRYETQHATLSCQVSRAAHNKLGHDVGSSQQTTFCTSFR